MARPVVLGNGQLFVGLDEDGLVHDFYYPYVGLENLTTARSDHHMIGVWVDGEFSWLDDERWERIVDFQPDALVSLVAFHSAELGLTLRLNDFVDHEYNALVRLIEVSNERSEERDFRLFMHQVFEISRGGRSDTALFVPDAHYILDYKGRTNLAIGGKHEDETPFDQYAVGNYRIEGKLGAFVDAEDGELSMSAIEHGGVDSVIRFASTIPPLGVTSMDYWVVAGHTKDDVESVHDVFMATNMDERLEAVRSFWHEWLTPAMPIVTGLPETQRSFLLKSLLIVKAHCDLRGSVLASGDSTIYESGRDYYSYCWPRDAVCSLWPLLRLGLCDETRSFLTFARDVMHPDGYMLHKYQPDRAFGSTWHPLVQDGKPELAIQEDETAGVIFLAREFLTASGDRDFVESLFVSFIVPAANFLCGFVDEATGLPHASYDLWEQVFLTTSYSTAVTIAGLEAAAALADEFDQPSDGVRWQRAADGVRENLDKLLTEKGYFARGICWREEGGTEVNDLVDISSLFGPFMYAGLAAGDERMEKTLAAVEESNLDTSPLGGVIRYPGDDYFLHNREYPGNPWIVCTLWLAQYYLSLGRQDEAEKLLDWAFDRCLPSGVLGEQFDAESGVPLGVAPLVWSHAEVINTILDLHGHPRPLATTDPR